MTDLALPPRSAERPANRLEPVVFNHARVALLTVTTAGVVVDVNAAAAELLGRMRYELVQEPIGQHVLPLSGVSIGGCLAHAARSPDAESFGTCAVRRRGARDIAMELVVSSGCRVSGRDLLLLQLVPLPGRAA